MADELAKKKKKLSKGLSIIDKNDDLFTFDDEGKKIVVKQLKMDGVKDNLFKMPKVGMSKEQVEKSEIFQQAIQKAKMQKQLADDAKKITK